MTNFTFRPAVRKCSVDGCDSGATRRGMCNLHYRRLMKYGDPHKIMNRPSGSGSVRTDGYVMHETGGRSVLEHVRVAEKALGKRLPEGAVVHHVDENRSNNNPGNLVVCPSAAYHQLIHSRMRAFEACGHYDWLKCQVCKKWSPPDQIKVYKPSMAKRHMNCKWW